MSVLCKRSATEDERQSKYPRGEATDHSKRFCQDNFHSLYAFLSTRDFVVASRSDKTWHHASWMVPSRKGMVVLHVDNIHSLLTSPTRRHMSRLGVAVTVSGNVLGPLYAALPHLEQLDVRVDCPYPVPPTLKKLTIEYDGTRWATERRTEYETNVCKQLGTHLEEITFRGHWNPSMEIVHAMVAMSSLVKCTLSRNLLPSELEILGMSNSLRHLHLISMHWTTDKIHSLVKRRTTPSPLVDLDTNLIDDETGNALSVLPNLTRLSFVYIGQIEGHFLNTLSLVDVEVGGFGISPLFVNLSHASSITTLRLIEYRPMFEPESLFNPLLRPMIQLTSLTLNCPSTLVFGHLVNLTELVLVDYCLHSSELSSLANLSQLTRLVVDRCDMSPDEVGRLNYHDARFDSVTWPRLHTFSIAKTQTS